MTTHKRQRQSRWRRVPLENLAMSTAPQPAKTGAFGERMRREREMRGIKLEEIAESTKIGKRNLEALEQERFDQLPGGIFNKGFVRAYAKYLGLDEEQALAHYQMQLEVQGGEPPRSSAPRFDALEDNDTSSWTSTCPRYERPPPPSSSGMCSW